MGQTLSAPVTQKVSKSGANDRLLYAVTAMQGWRLTMEDSHAAILDLDENKDEKNTFFAVYDGHGGGSVAKFAGENVHKRLVTEDAYREHDYKVAMKNAFLGTDEDIRADPAHTRDPSGCTAVAALVTHDGKIYVANAGDSRSVMSVKGEVKPLSFDHKPGNKVERDRIEGAGGYVEYGRVNGNLALSRALGDFEFKKNLSLKPEKQIITADPEITIHDIDDEDEFVVFACDGIWDCLTSQQVVDFVRLYISEGKELSEICEMLCNHCLAPDTSQGIGIGCDNMTVLIVAILHGRTKEEWYSWMTDRVQIGHGYETPPEVPQLYSANRLRAFRARQEVLEAREQARREKEEMEKEEGVSPSQPSQSLLGSILASSSGITFQSKLGISSDSLSSTRSDSDDDDLDGDTESVEEFRARLAKLGDDDDLQDMSPDHQVEASPPPTPLSNGDLTASVQFLGLEKESRAVKVEGLLDNGQQQEPLRGA